MNGCIIDKLFACNHFCQLNIKTAYVADDCKLYECIISDPMSGSK